MIVIVKTPGSQIGKPLRVDARESSIYGISIYCFRREEMRPLSVASDRAAGERYTERERERERERLSPPPSVHVSLYLITAPLSIGEVGSRPKKMYGQRLGDGVEYHLMSPTPRR